jgi:hypothetical protein
MMILFGLIPSEVINQLYVSATSFIAAGNRLSGPWPIKARRVSKSQE